MEQRLSIGGVTMSFVSEEPDLDVELPASFETFRASPDSPSLVRMSVTRDEITRPVDGEPVFDSRALWQLFRRGREFVFRFCSPAFGPLPYKTASFSSDFATGRVVLNREYFKSRGPLYPLEYPLDELIVVHALGRGLGVEMHACGVVDHDGRGQLFVGQSGAGKSTMARLWRTATSTTILSDDRIVLRSEAGEIWMYGTPWHGEEQFAAPVRVSLKRIVFLRHGHRNELKPLTRAGAVAQMFACSFPLFHSPEGLGFTLKFLESVVQCTRCEELEFVPDPSAVTFLQADG